MEILRHEFDRTVLWYLVTEEKAVSMLLIPKEKEGRVKKAWLKPNDGFDARCRYMHQWSIGRLVHLQLAHHNRQSGTMKFSQSAGLLKFFGQETEKSNKTTKIITTLKADEGYGVIHTVTHFADTNAFVVDTEFINNSERDFTLEMLSSFSLDNLSPFQEDDAPCKYSFHRFYGGWSLEGKHVETSIEDLALEKPYAGNFLKSEKFGSVGAYPSSRYFPIAVFEDKENNILWAARLAHNASWQMELTRNQDTLSFSGGIADCEFGLWSVTVKPGAGYKAPSAYVSAVSGDVSDACQSVTGLDNIACENYNEGGLPVCYNEFCTSWGQPTQDKMIAYAEKLKGRGIKYVVIDAGWSEGCYGGQGGNGEWIVDKKIFPDMKKMCEEIRGMGMIPGIWFEFEVTTEGSRMFAPEFDSMHLKRNGTVINTGGWRTYWDFRNPEVTEYLSEKVIKFLKDNGFGYIKVDYNGNPGAGCDGACSLGEGMKEHLNDVAEFFKRIKKEIPDIVIENCASGGHRLEPVMLGVSAMSSFSDAHEADEIPYIAANLHNLILPRQSLVWAVVHQDDSFKRMVYTLAASFLGRICLSGDVDKLNDEQWGIVEKAISFYNGCSDIILKGVSKIYGNRGDSMRYATGTQALVRKTNTEAMVVVHSFKKSSDDFEIILDNEYVIEDEFYNNGTVTVKGNVLTVHSMPEDSAVAVRLRKTDE